MSPEQSSGGKGADLYSYSLTGPASPGLEALAFAADIPLGAGLKAARESLRLTLDQVAEATKIRSSYLAALEAMDLSRLPSRPFTLGYVRAYAQVLGLDEERALTRFKQDAPDREEPLRAPVGVPRAYDPRFGMLAVAASVVVAAIVIWNVAQRVMSQRDSGPARDTVATVVEPMTGPVKLGAALPPPQESTVPDPYVTPGLFGPAEQPVETPDKAGPLRPPTEMRRFVAKGAVFGVSAEQSPVVVQAVRSAGLVVRGGDNKVYFAQQLQGGQAYRAPVLPGLVIDVSSPEAMEVFVGGMLVGSLTAPVTPLSAILKAAPPLAPPTAAPAPSAASAPPANPPANPPAKTVAPTPAPAAANPGLAPAR